MNSYLQYSLKLKTPFVLRIEVIVVTFSLRLVYHQMKLYISCTNLLPVPLMGERVGFQLNEAHAFLGSMHFPQTHECFIISVMIKKVQLSMNKYDAK